MDDNNCLNKFTINNIDDQVLLVIGSYLFCFPSCPSCLRFDVCISLRSFANLCVLRVQALFDLRIAAGRETFPGPHARACGRTRRSGAASARPCPGLSSACSSNACFTAWKVSSSSGRNCTHIASIFSTPTPCSPVMVPPTSIDSLRIFGAELLGASRVRRAGWHRRGSADAGCRRRRGTRSCSAGRIPATDRRSH